MTATQSSAHMQAISVRGTDIRYVESGRGRPIVFVHGGAGDHRIWDNQRSVVAKRHRFIALDQRYFGTAPWPDDGVQFSLLTHVSDLIAFVQALDLGPVWLVGHSYGAVVVLATAIQCSELARGLFINEPPLTSVLDDPACAEVRRSWLQEAERIAAVAQTSDPGAAARSFYEWVNGQPGGFDALSAEERAVRVQNGRTIALQLSPATRASITCTQLGQIRVPVPSRRAHSRAATFSGWRKGFIVASLDRRS